MDQQREDTLNEKVLTAQEKQAIAKASKIVLSLDKTTKSLKFYLPNNPVLIKHQNDLMEQFNDFFKNNNELTLKITSTAFIFADQKVYESMQKSENFAFKLYNDGVRSITFYKELELTELLEFMQILNRGLDLKTDTDEDLVTLLWEKQFHNIKYQVVENIIETSLVQDGKSTEERIDEITGEDKSVYFGLGEEYADIIDIDEIPLTYDATNFGEMFKVKGVLAKDEVEKIEQEIDYSDSKENILLNFMDILPNVLHEEVTKQDIVKALNIVRSIIESLLFTGALAIAARVLAKLKQFPDFFGKGSVPIEKDIERFLEEFAGKEKIDEMINSLNLSFTGTTEDIIEYVGQLPEKSIPALLKAMAQVSDTSYRRALSTGISKIFRGDPNSLLKYFSVKVKDRADDLIFLLSQIQNDKVLDLVPHLIAHSDRSVKKGALAILKNFKGSPKSTKILLSTLEDSDIEIRTLALRIMASAESKEAARHLLARISSADFPQKEFIEKKSYFFSLAKISGNEFVPYLADIITAKRWFPKESLDELYQCTCFALGIIGNDRAKEVLEVGVRSKNKSIKKYCQNILRKIQMGSS